MFLHAVRTLAEEHRQGVHENSVLTETRGASSCVLRTRYYYGGAVRAGHVARMEKWEEEEDNFGVE